MALENLVNKVRKGWAGAALGLALAVAPMYSCGEEEKTVYKETVGGVYDGTFKVTEDPQDVIYPEDEQGDINVGVLPLDSENKYVKVGLFEWHDYERSQDGKIDDAWNDLFGDTFHVYGKITDNGKMDLDASVDAFDPWTNTQYFINWKVDCQKQEYVPEE